MTKTEQAAMERLQYRVERLEREAKQRSAETVRLTATVQFLLDELQRLSPEWYAAWNTGDITVPKSYTGE